MTRISSAFQKGRKVLVAYAVGGYYLALVLTRRRFFK